MLLPAAQSLEAHDELLCGDALERNLVHLFKERVRVRALAGDEEPVDLFGRRGALELLAVEQLGLDHLERLARLCKLFGALAVPAAVAGRDEVGDTGRLVGEAVWGVSVHAQTKPHMYDPSAKGT